MVALSTRRRLTTAILAAFAISFAALPLAANAGTIFVDGSAAFASISQLSGNCAHSTIPDCSTFPNSCHCVTGDAALKEHNLNTIEAGSYTIHLELLQVNGVAGMGLCTSGANAGSSCVTASDCGQTCSFQSSGTCVSCGLGCGKCSNDAMVSCSNDVPCNPLTFCSASGAICSSDADCGGTPVCHSLSGMKIEPYIGYAMIKNATTGDVLVFSFSSAGSRQRILGELHSVSAAAGLASATGLFGKFAGELDFSIVRGTALAKGGASTSPAMELSISGGLHTP